MAESIAIFYVKQFAMTMVKVFGPQYLRAPNAQDTQRLLEMNKTRGFLGMLRYVDCMHWKWRNCPKHGMDNSRVVGRMTIILEAFADHETWTWHAYFGMPGSCNDINVLDRSPLFAKLANEEAPPVTFEANGRTYSMGTILQMGSTQGGVHLSSRLQNPKYVRLYSG
ncbi:uncharacterized protein [Aegilops tauschii subsp. strangulata]|uniref:uncharacterized protein n=1 Tax=Aegilops tauschii subsp. strangulata TaxID=200361 RepID=UPI00098B9342|nr:uncharacterized protein LOC109764244 [Aegilops tauschii subsp. strangulata]